MLPTLKMTELYIDPNHISGHKHRGGGGTCDLYQAIWKNPDSATDEGEKVALKVFRILRLGRDIKQFKGSTLQ